MFCHGVFKRCLFSDPEHVSYPTILSPGSILFGSTWVCQTWPRRRGSAGRGTCWSCMTRKRSTSGLRCWCRMIARGCGCAPMSRTGAPCTWWRGGTASVRATRSSFCATFATSLRTSASRSRGARPPRVQRRRTESDTCQNGSIQWTGRRWMRRHAATAASTTGGRRSCGTPLVTYTRCSPLRAACRLVCR